MCSACAGQAVSGAAPEAFSLPDSVSAHDGATGTPISSSQLISRLGAADLVLLGEVHDNPVHHQLRGSLLHALPGGHAAVVFEQLPESGTALPPPAPAAGLEAWLEQAGFDRRAWRWPLHRPVIEAAMVRGRSLWGAGVSRERLRSVVQQGESGAPEHLRPLLERSPLDHSARSALDRALIEGHCGSLSATMLPGLRAAQRVRDAAMTLALVEAGTTGPAWLMAGNGHLRRDMGVPRYLGSAAPASAVLVVGLLERERDGSLPSARERRGFDIVILTPRAPREDPCASL